MTASPAAEIRYEYIRSMQMRRKHFHPTIACLNVLPSQVDQLRSELMQERSERHDLEMDKSALERQVPFV